MNRPPGDFMVVPLGIVYDPKDMRILIVRRENDPYIDKLTWCFPGGKAGHEKDIVFYLKDALRERLDIEVEIKSVVFAWTCPENKYIELIYFLCELEKGIPSPRGSFEEARWIKSTDVQQWFTTSLHPDVANYLTTLTIG